MTAPLRELALLFLRLGATAFGGPLAHIALMEEELVTRRQWLSRQQFLDLVGATNLIPGPNSTEVAMHIGWLRAGPRGLFVAGTCFILPAFVMVLCLAWLYQRYGTLPQARGVLYGAAPVVVAVVAQAGWKFALTALKSRLAQVVAAASVALVLLGVPELWVIALAALLGLAVGRQSLPALANEPSSQPPVQAPALLLIAGAPVAANAWGVFGVFLKIGSIIYGSGYVLLAFLRADLVERLGWVSDRQLLDAVSVGQITPGPLFTTATFLGYQIAGWGGAIAATVGIFGPSFAFVWLLATLLRRVQGSPRARVFLDCVNAASLALMAVVLAELAHSALLVPARTRDFLPLGIGFIALGLLFRRVNSAGLMAAGAATGWAMRGM